MHPLLLLVTLAALAAPPTAVLAKVYERCELARELATVHGVSGDDLAVWVCIAQHESDYNTTAIGHVGEGGDHGIFQISDLYWCSHSPGRGKACGMSCSQLLDDNIGDDMACAKRIHREHQGLTGNGFNAWAVYPLYCKRPDRAAKYVEGCFAGTGNEIEPQPFYGLPPPAITAPPPPAWPRPRPPAAVYGVATTTPAPAAASRALTASWPSWRGWGQAPSAPPAMPRATSRVTPTPHRFSAGVQQQTAVPRRFATDPRNFWNWAYLPRRRWF